MKKFVTRIVLLVVLFCLLVASLIEVTNQILASNLFIKTKANTQYIILGHSHPEHAFNDSLIVNFSNHAHSAEAYFYTLLKVKKIIEQNNTVETVFIEFTNNQIAKGMDEWTWGDEYLQTKYILYAPLMHWNENQVLLKHNFTGVMRALPILLKKNSYYILTKKFNYRRAGGYQYLVREKVDSLLQSVIPFKTVNSDEYEVSSFNIERLREMITYLQQCGKKVYLIRSPLHSKSSFFRNEEVLLQLVHEKFYDVEFLDFSRFPLSNEEYGDFEHLNFKGARKFSQWFNELIQAGLLNEPEKQTVINRRMKTPTPDQK